MKSLAPNISSCHNFKHKFIKILNLNVTNKRKLFFSQYYIVSDKLIKNKTPSYEN